MADIIVQAFAALVVALSSGLALVLWLNSRQHRELERSYEPSFRPQDVINALVVCTHSVCRTTKKIVDASLEEFAHCISSATDEFRQRTAALPVAKRATVQARPLRQ